MKSETYAIEVSSLSFSYKNGPHKTLALDSLSFQVNSGEFVSILGPSGCGKSTVLTLIDGLIFPTDGHIFIEGKEVTGPGPDRAVVFQSANLIPWQKIWQNIGYGLKLRGVSKTEILQKVEGLIKLVSLEGFENFYPYQLSGGMQQRVNLARALAVEPKVLLMDEPFAALDAQTREVMQIELTRIWQETKRTTVFITHDIEEAILLSDRVIVLTHRPGKVKTVVDINLKRPRQALIRQNQEFLDYKYSISNLIMEENLNGKSLTKNINSREARS